jgi:CRP-like cAMP-binding protein
MRNSLYILGSISDEDIEWIIQFGRRRIVPHGTVLIRQGVPVEDLFLILDGRFSVTDELAGGRELARLGSGEILGEMSFVDANPPSATVTAVDDGAVMGLSRRLLQERLNNNTSFAARFYYSLALFLSDRLRATSKLGNGSKAQRIDEQVLQDDELDPNVLDNVHLAGARFKHIVERLSQG